ncbi:MAG: dUTP diphosphatase [Planctomycetota bacterium]
MSRLTVRVQQTDPALERPGYAHEGDAGFDLRAAEAAILKPGERRLIAAGIKVAIPAGFVGLIWDRSGLAARQGIHVLAGVVDSGYRGEVKVVLKNLGDADLAVTVGMRIAQMLVQPVAAATLEFVTELDNSSRGEGGFGSTGIK